jgi:adenosylhomocysteine nucleosidase
MIRVAIIAAMAGELKPFLHDLAKEGWVHERRGNVELWRLVWPDWGEWVAACTGAGMDAAARAFAAVEQDGPISAVISTGWAGALREEYAAGRAFWVTGVVDARTGERFGTAHSAEESAVLKGHGLSQAVPGTRRDAALAAEGLQIGERWLPQGLKHGEPYRSPRGAAGAVPFQIECWLVTSPKVADEAEKLRLAAAYKAGLVDMEAAAIARLARMRGIPFYCLKGVSDGVGDKLPDFNHFIAPDGRFRIVRFVLFAILRPWYWPVLVRMGENGKRAAQGIAESLLDLLNE